jgi:2'-phosphotransferase
MEESKAPKTMEESKAPKTMEESKAPKPHSRLSHALSAILRHRADKLGLKMRADGFVPLDDVLRLKQMKHATVESVQEVVAQDAKQRYTLQDEGGRLWIRANQGHSVQAVQSEELLTRVTDASQFPHCIHGTTHEAWRAIAKSGLNRMGRRHVHFCSKPFQSTEIISGMRNTSEVLIHVDIAAAVRDGVPFYVSSNQVLLSEGVAGVIPPRYFAQVVDAKTGTSLM